PDLHSSPTRRSSDLELGLATDVVEFAPRLMPRQLDDSASNMLQAKIESMGIGVYLNKSTRKIYGNNRIEALHFADGSQLKTDMRSEEHTSELQSREN